MWQNRSAHPLSALRFSSSKVWPHSDSTDGAHTHRSCGDLWSAWSRPLLTSINPTAGMFSSRPLLSNMPFNHVPQHDCHYHISHWSLPGHSMSKLTLISWDNHSGLIWQIILKNQKYALGFNSIFSNVMSSVQSYSVMLSIFFFLLFLEHVEVKERICMHWICAKQDNDLTCMGISSRAHKQDVDKAQWVHSQHTAVFSFLTTCDFTDLP